MGNKLDQHFTPDDIAAKLACSVVERYDPYRVRHYLEPSVGEGAFVRGLQNAGIPLEQITTCDLDKSLEADYHCDFLKSEWGLPEDTIAIGNPPFGRNGTTAQKFIDHAITFCNVVGFILPAGRVFGQYHTVLDLGDTKFSGTNAKCVWAELGNYPFPVYSSANWVAIKRRPIERINFVGPKDDYDIVIQRCGGGFAKPTECNGTGQGKLYIQCENQAILKAVAEAHLFRDYLVRPKTMTHQPSMNRQEFLELVLMRYYYGSRID